jgi:hypothetical protein
MPRSISSHHGLRITVQKNDPRPGRDPDAQEHIIPSQAIDLRPERDHCLEKMTQDQGGILMPRSITSLHRLRITIQKK